VVDALSTHNYPPFSRRCRVAVNAIPAIRVSDFVDAAQENHLGRPDFAARGQAVQQWDKPGLVSKEQVLTLQASQPLSSSFAKREKRYCCSHHNTCQAVYELESTAEAKTALLILGTQRPPKLQSPLQFTSTQQLEMLKSNWVPLYPEHPSESNSLLSPFLEGRSSRTIKIQPAGKS